MFEAQGVRVHGVRDLRDGATCAVWGERRVRVMRLRDGDGDGDDDGDDGDGDGDAGTTAALSGALVLSYTGPHTTAFAW